ncbi:MAG: hypothetical protein ACE5H1_01965 [Thermodesulfobacteriota bacterium]
MVKDPAILLYTSDFMAGTMFFTDEQTGKYIKLLCMQHQTHPKRLSKEEMLVICKKYDQKIFNKFIKDKCGFYYNKRMEDEIVKRKNYSKSRSKNRLGKKHMKNICKTYDKHMENENENENINKDKKENGIFFDSIWSKYPNKVGRKMAEKHFKNSVKNKKDFNDLNTALTNYLSSKRVQRGYIQNGSTFMNNWRDWIDYKEESCKKCNDKGSFISATGYSIVCDCPAGKGK